MHSNRYSYIFRSICCCLTFFLFFGGRNTETQCWGQLPTEIGESVRVYAVGEWRDGVVIDQKKGEVLVEYVFVRSSQKVFQRREVLRLYEVGCMDFGRMWESTAGTKIEAALKALEGDKLTLVRPDMEELVVPADKLSKRDQAYAKNIAANFNAAVSRGQTAAITPDLPELEQFGRQFGSYSMFTEAGQNKVQPLGSIPSFLKFGQAGTGIELVRREQDLVAVIPVGGPDELVLMSTSEDHMGRAPFPSQLYWVSMKKKQVISKVYVTEAHMAMDYDPRTKRLLTFHPASFFDESKSPSQYVLWDLKPGDSKPVPVVRWQVDSAKEVFLRKYFAKIIDKDLVVTKVDRQTYAAWNVSEKKEVYRFQTQSFFDAPVVQTRDREHLIVPEDRQVSVVNAKTGQFTMNLSVKDSHVSGANTNSAGTKLAAITENNLYVWDLTQAEQPPTVYSAPLIGSPFSSRLDWIDDDHVLGESFRGRILYNLKLELPVWSYSVEMHDYFENEDPLKNFVLDGMYFYVARPSLSNIIAVGAIELPGPGVREIVEKVERSQILILKAGVHVGLDLEDVQEPERVRSWLQAEIEKNGWVYDSQADIRVVASMGIGSMQTVQYQEFGGRGPVESASFRPHYSKVQIVKPGDNGNVVLWQAGTSTGAPPVIRGGNAQTEVNRMQQPNLKFFETLDIEDEVIDPKYARGFGSSMFGLRGLRVVSSEPPGRDDDPYAAEEAARKKQRESQQDSQNDRGNLND